eukprot:6213613-Pleurochrysis_carterae.AAC.1
MFQYVMEACLSLKVYLTRNHPYRNYSPHILGRQPSRLSDVRSDYWYTLFAILARDEGYC